MVTSPPNNLGIRCPPHPATFPPRVPEYCFKLHGLSRASLTMNPFLGLGSTAVAAARLGLDCIGVEIDEHYLREAVARTAARSKPPTLPRSALPHADASPQQAGENKNRPGLQRQPRAVAGRSLPAAYLKR